MNGLIPEDYDVRFIYGEETRCALVSYRGMVEYIGPFINKETAIDAGVEWCRTRGWIGKDLVVARTGRTNDSP